MRHIISILLENESGALSRVAGLFSARAYNIESLTVAPTEDPSLSRMTLVTSGSDDVIEQITKQLNKLINVLKIVELDPSSSVQREHMLVKVRIDAGTRSQILEAVNLFRARVVDVAPDLYHGRRARLTARRARRIKRQLRLIREGELNIVDTTYSGRALYQNFGTRVDE